MNSKTKRRLGMVTGIIVIVLILVLAVVGGNSAARSVSVAEALELQDESKIQVSGNVVKNSFDIEGDVLTFQIYDVEADPDAAAPLNVRYDGGVSATFGNDVTAICTGKKNAEGVLSCSELVTKCPSKYEEGKSALSVAELLDYDDSIVDRTVKVVGVMKSGTLANVEADQRFVVVDDQTGVEMPVKFDGALSDETGEGATLVLTGSLNAARTFTATNVALEG